MICKFIGYLFMGSGLIQGIAAYLSCFVWVQEPAIRPAGLAAVPQSEWFTAFIFIASLFFVAGAICWIRGRILSKKYTSDDANKDTRQACWGIVIVLMAGSVFDLWLHVDGFHLLEKPQIIHIQTFLVCLPASTACAFMIICIVGCLIGGLVQFVTGKDV